MPEWVSEVGLETDALAWADLGTLSRLGMKNVKEQSRFVPAAGRVLHLEPSPLVSWYDAELIVISHARQMQSCSAQNNMLFWRVMFVSTAHDGPPVPGLHSQIP